MSDPIENAAEQASTETQQQPTQETAAPPAGKEQAVGRAVSAAAKLFGGLNNLEGGEKKGEPKKEDKPADGKSSDQKPAEEAKAENPKKPEEPVNPIFGKKKSKAAKAAEIKDAVAEGNRELVETIKAQQQKPAPVVEKPSEVQLSAKEQRLVAQLKKLEEINPAYKDVSTKFEEFKRKEAAYEAEWLKNHPDEDFDPDDAAHSKFYDRHEPSIDEEDLEAAKEALIAESAKRTAREEMEKEIAPIRQQQRHKDVVEALAPKLTETFTNVAKEAAAAINPEFAKIKDLTKIADEDPLAAEILGGVVNHWIPVIQAAEYAYNGAQFDPESAEGRRLGEVVTEIEQGLKSLPADEQVRDGRKFATLEEYFKMTKTDQKKHWFIQSDDITQYASYRMKLDSQKFYQQEQSRLEKLAGRMGYVRNSGQQPTKQDTQKQQEQPANSGVRAAPAVGGSSPAPAPSALRPDPNANPKLNVAKRLGWA
jgi:hypothetical protein